MARLVEALKKVGQTFELFQTGEIGPCESTPSPVQIPNLVPSSYCRVPIEKPPDVIDSSDPELQIAPDDEKIDVRAKFALKRMLRPPDPKQDPLQKKKQLEMNKAAEILILGIKEGELAGIYGDDLGEAVKVARAYGTERWLLVPEGEDAALILDKEKPLKGPPVPDRPPKIIFRGDTPDISKQPGRLDEALLEASKPFKLWQSYKLGPCNESTIPVRNLVPSSYCQLTGHDLHVTVTEAGTEPSEFAPPVPDARVVAMGPHPSAATTPPEITDMSGETWIRNLAPGTYQVTVSKEGHEEASQEIIVGKDQDQAASFAEIGELALVPGILLQLNPKKPLYDRKNALKYAKYFCDRVCSDSYTMFASGHKRGKAGDTVFPTGGGGLGSENDCTHFISCCIGACPKYQSYKGGGLYLSSPYYKRTRTPVYGHTEPGSLVNHLKGTNKIYFAHMSQNGDLSFDKKNPQFFSIDQSNVINELKNKIQSKFPNDKGKGDIIAYGKEKNIYTLGHAAIIISDEWVIASHTISRCLSTGDKIDVDSLKHHFDYFIYVRIKNYSNEKL